MCVSLWVCLWVCVPGSICSVWMSVSACAWNCTQARTDAPYWQGLPSSTTCNIPSPQVKEDLDLSRSSVIVKNSHLVQIFSRYTIKMEANTFEPPLFQMPHLELCSSLLQPSRDSGLFFPFYRYGRVSKVETTCDNSEGSRSGSKPGWSWQTVNSTVVQQVQEAEAVLTCLPMCSINSILENPKTLLVTVDYYKYELGK